jgi:hypothetical protein
MVLISFAWDPTGRVAYRLFVPKKIDQEWDEVKVLLRKLASKETKDAIEFAIDSVEEGDTEDAEEIFQLCGKICFSIIAMDEGALRENVSELLGAFGVNAKQTDALLDSAGLRLLTWCLRPVLEPTLTKHGLTWEDVLPVLETIDCIDELKAAIKEPVAFLEQIAKGSPRIAKKLAIMHLKPLLGSCLTKHGLEWSDVVPVLEEVDSVEELKEAVADAEGFLERLANACGPAAKKLAIMHLKPPLEPCLAKHGLEWSDVVPVLEEVDSVEELREAIGYPMAFLDHASKAGAEKLGMTINASLCVLEVVPGKQGAQKGVTVGDVISCIGSTSLSYDESTRMDIKVALLLIEAKSRKEPFVTIKFNSGAKSAEFKILSLAMASSAEGLALETSPRGSQRHYPNPTLGAVDTDTSLHRHPWLNSCIMSCSDETHEDGVKLAAIENEAVHFAPLPVDALQSALERYGEELGDEGLAGLDDQIAAAQSAQSVLAQPLGLSQSVADALPLAQLSSALGLHVSRPAVPPAAVVVPADRQHSNTSRRSAPAVYDVDTHEDIREMAASSQPVTADAIETQLLMLERARSPPPGPPLLAEVATEVLESLSATLSRSEPA